VTDTRQPSRPPAGGNDEPTLGGTGITETWLGQMRPKMVTLARRFLWNTDDAEEVAQEALALIWRRAHQLRKAGTQEAWLYRTAINLSISRLRHKQIRARIVPMAEPPDRVNVSRQQETDELAEKVRRVIAELPDRQKTAIVLRDMQGMTYDRSQAS